MTLMELMTAVVIAGLLAAVGIPSYTAFANRAKVAVAIADIGAISGMLYRWQLATRDFPETLANAGLDGRIDPWGNPYEYLKIDTAKTGQVRRDRNLRPINTDFDLYSRGPDGQTQTQLQGAKAQDDIVRANNGQFIGPASDY
jgi:general secretion pathway protein G